MLFRSIDLFANNMEDGLVEANILANFIVRIISVFTHSTVSKPIIKVGYDITTDSKETEFVQYLQLYGEMFKQKRGLDFNLFEKMLQSLLDINDKNISRAIRWYNNGLNEADSIDRFMYYWLGLESINNLLAERLGAKSEIRKCEKCGNEYEIPTAKGIRSAFEEFSEAGIADFKKCRKIRVQLQHGHGDIEKIIEVAADYSEICRKVLLYGLFLLLKIDKHSLKMLGEPLYNLNMPLLEFKGVFGIEPQNLDKMPMLTINLDDLEIDNKNNKRAISFRKTIDTNIPVTLKLKSINLISEVGVTMKINHIGLENKKDK